MRNTEVCQIHQMQFNERIEMNLLSYLVVDMLNI